MVEGVFIELSVIIIIAVLVSALVRAIRLPLIVGYILAGILVSPYFLNLVRDVSSLTTFAQMGVAVLLFMTGLNLNPKVVKEVGKVAIITGIGQIIFTFVLGFAIAKLFGFTSIVSAYIAIAISFSSTIIIMKLLSDRGDTNTLYGKISIGFLIVQDLVAILILMFISSIGGVGDSPISLQKIGIGIGVTIGLLLLGTYLLPSVTKRVARSQELLLLFSVSWALALSSLFAYLGFSIEIGALLGGITLSVSPYRYEIGAKMKPLRDFFLLMFFIVLGSQLTFGNISEHIIPIAAFSLLVLIGNPIIVMFLMGRLGYTKRNGFLSGLTVSQISEFSFILVALGITVGHLTGDILSMMTIIGLITMAVSASAILHGRQLFSRVSSLVSVFEKKGPKVDDGKYHQDEDYDIILFGYNRIGYSLKDSFRKLKKKFLVVDNNPDIISNLVCLGIDCRYGDADDLELLEELPLKKSKMVISTIPDLETNLLLVRNLKKINRDVIFLAVSHQIEDALKLYESGVTYVITPHFLGGKYTSAMIEKYGFRKEHFQKDGARGANELLKRKKEGQKDVLHERD